MTEVQRIKKRLKEVLATARAKGVQIYEADYIIDMGEPLLGRDAREGLEALVGKHGTFKTVKTLDVDDVLTLAGVPEGDDRDMLNEGLHILGDTIFEAPPGYRRPTLKALVFTFEKARPAGRAKGVGIGPYRPARP